jgi:hypothetical protein
MPRLLESVVVTTTPGGEPHLVPFGLIEEGNDYVVAPFRPSPSIVNLDRHRFLSAAWPADIRVLAGCVTGRRDWPLVPCERIPGMRLECAVAHAELEVVDVTDDPVRPRYRCRMVHHAAHQVSFGVNRAQAAVLEAAILSTRLHFLPREKVVAEMSYLAIAVSKTAGLAEINAWTWIEDKVRSALALDGPGFLAQAASPPKKETLP